MLDPDIISMIELINETLVNYQRVNDKIPLKKKNL